MKDQTEGLEVRMLGEFSIRYKGEPVLQKAGKSSKASHLLQILLYAGPGGIAREPLLSRLYGRDGRRDRSNNLRVVMCHLRRMLRESGLPEEEYIHMKDGTYCFAGSFPVNVDAHAFGRLYKKAETVQGQERLRILKKACALYRGYFLPALSGEEWVVMEDAYYQRLYYQSMEEISSSMKEQGEYEELLELCRRAAALYPLDEWQICQMECLTALGRAREAFELYRKTEKMYFEELTAIPSERMLDCFRKMGSRIQMKTEEFPRIQERLCEQGGSGNAYYCSFPGFVDSFRISMRIAERLEQKMYLLLCTVIDERKRCPQISGMDRDISDILADSIGEALGSGGIFTRYNRNQFLAILLDISEETCQALIGCIDAGFRRRERSRRISISYQVSPMTDKSKNR